MSQVFSADRTRLPWGRLLVRMFLVVVPGQFLGIFVGGFLVAETGLVSRYPDLGNVISALAGVVAGLGLGLLVVPAPGRLRTYVAATAVFGMAVAVLLLLVAHLSRPTGTPGITGSTFIAGAVIVGGLQALAASVVWVLRGHRR